MSYPDEKKRQKAIGNIISGTYHYVDIEGWKSLNLATTHRVFRELLNERKVFKEIADCRLEEIDQLILECKEGKEDRDRIYDKAKEMGSRFDKLKAAYNNYENVKLFKTCHKATHEAHQKTVDSFTDKLSDALEVTDALNSEREKLKGKLDYSNSQITEQFGYINKLRRQVAELQNSEWPTTKAYNELVDKINYANKLVDDQARSIREDASKMVKADCEITRLKCRNKTQSERIQELKNLGFAEAYGGTDWRVRPEVTETDWKIGREIGDQIIYDLRKDLALVQRERHARDCKITQLKERRDYLQKAVNVGSVVQSDQARKIRDLEKDAARLQTLVVEQKEHHLRYYKANSKLTNENSELRQHIKDLKEIDRKSDTKIKDLKETIQERDDELKEWHNERMYFISSLIVTQVTIDREEVWADQGKFLVKGGFCVGSYTRCGDGYVVFCKGSLSAPVTTRIR